MGIEMYQSAQPLVPWRMQVTQAEYEALALPQVSELWTKYGELTGIWCFQFNFGY